MAWADLFAGFAFYLILEGLFPFAAPQAWRRGLASLAQLEDGQLRTFGLVVVISGLLVLFVVRG
ncbi:MAG: DUF2065 domain-containing protein [Gammaproteobacteria bacterium]|nr:DUF2065 domain-containing protein [Gammaproteobacteria bacterium]